jgi:penicillin-binding protein 1A
VQIAQRVGLDHVIGMARRLGVTSDLDPVPSIALGSTEVSLMELTTAYGHLAARGAIVYPYGITKIDTAGGETLYERQQSGNGMALRSDVVGKMSEMMMSVVESGTGKAARIGRPVAGKTGTTSDYRDAWFMGFTPDLVTGVWVGNDDNTPMKKVTGGMIPAQIWHNYMIEALAQTPIHSIPTDGDFDMTLPWQRDQPPPFPEQQKAMERPAGNNDVRLGHSFWDKLMNVR